MYAIDCDLLFALGRGVILVAPQAIFSATPIVMMNLDVEAFSHTWWATEPDVMPEDVCVVNCTARLLLEVLIPLQQGFDRSQFAVWKEGENGFDH